MNNIEYHISELKKNSTRFRDNEESLLYCNLNLSLLYLLIDCPEQASESFEYVLHNFKKMRLISIQFGLTHVAVIARLFSIKYGAYNNLSTQLDVILNHLMEKVSRNTLNVDSLNGHFSVARYLLNTTVGKQTSVNFFQKYKGIFIENNFPHFNKCDDALNEYERVEFPFGYLDLGVPHGLAGTLFFLVDYFNNTGDEDAEIAIKKVVSQLFEAYYNDEYPIIKGFLSNDKHVRAQDITLKSEYFSWCYGTLGIANALNYSKKFLDKQEKQKLDIILSYLNDRAINFKTENNCFCHGYWGAILIKNELGILNQQDLKKLETMNDIYTINNKGEVDSDVFSHIDGIASEILCQVIINYSRTSPYDEKLLLKQLLLI